MSLVRVNQSANKYRLGDAILLDNSARNKIKNFPIIDWRNNFINSWLSSLNEKNIKKIQIKVIANIFIIPVILWDIETKDEICHL